MAIHLSNKLYTLRFVDFTRHLQHCRTCLTGQVGTSSLRKANPSGPIVFSINGPTEMRTEIKA
ncbi:MAG: hypothetical protein OXE83_15305, partial [Gammaproteobacteria bacterium]|nr:hypothetical protein [Gammaproteobacteria bacterium]